MEFWTGSSMNQLPGSLAMSEHRQWLVHLYKHRPLLFLGDAKQAFTNNFRMNISVESVCRILHCEGLTWKTLERSAIQIRHDDMYRFCFELNNLNWDLFNLVFLDEVSFDNRSILRSRGYSAKGKLCFIGLNGMLESSIIDGAFIRLTFFHHCKQFALRSKLVEIFPGYNLIWILNGALYTAVKRLYPIFGRFECLWSFCLHMYHFII